MRAFGAGLWLLQLSHEPKQNSHIDLFFCLFFCLLSTFELRGFVYFSPQALKCEVSLKCTTQKLFCVIIWRLLSTFVYMTWLKQRPQFDLEVTELALSVSLNWIPRWLDVQEHWVYTGFEPQGNHIHGASKRQLVAAATQYFSSVWDR